MGVLHRVLFTYGPGDGPPCKDSHVSHPGSPRLMTCVLKPWRRVDRHDAPTPKTRGHRDVGLDGKGEPTTYLRLSRPPRYLPPLPTQWWTLGRYFWCVMEPGVDLWS